MPMGTRPCTQSGAILFKAGGFIEGDVVKRMSSGARGGVWQACAFFQVALIALA